MAVSTGVVDGFSRNRVFRSSTKDLRSALVVMVPRAYVNRKKRPRQKGTKGISHKKAQDFCAFLWLFLDQFATASGDRVVNGIPGALNRKATEVIGFVAQN